MVVRRALTSERIVRVRERERERRREMERERNGRDGRGRCERTVEAATREERLRLRRYVVYVAGLQRGRRAPLSHLVEMVEDTRSASPRPIYIRRVDERK